MRIKIFPLIAAGAAVILSGISQAYAKTLAVDTLEVNPDTQMVSVSGSLSEAEHLQKVTLTVISDSDGSVNYINQISVQKDGSFSFTYRMQGASGYYTAHMNADGADEDYTKQIRFVDPNVINGIIAEVNRKTSGGALYEYISSSEVLDNLAPDLESLEAIASVSGACELLINDKKTDFVSATEFIKELRNKTILCGINTAEKADAVLDLIGKYHTELALDEKPRFKKYDNTDKKASGIAQRIIKADFKNADEFAAAFEAYYVLEEIRNVAGYGEVDGILKENNDILGLDFTAYEKLSSKTPVIQALAGVDFEAVSELEAKFADACSAQYKKEHTASGTASGGGGGGSSSGGGLGLVVHVSDNTTVSSNTGTDQNTAVSGANASDNPAPAHKYFDDLSNYEWAEENINLLYENGIISGVTDRRFDPASEVTREQFVKMLVEMLKLDTKNSGSVSFHDVDNTAWYAKYVYAAADAGLISGYPDGSFGVGSSIIRQDIAVILTRALEAAGKTLEEVNDAKEFSDSDKISDYAQESVSYMQRAGIINGFESGTFEPQRSATRAEAAKILCLVYLKIK